MSTSERPGAVAGLLLAAGAGRRMGGPKALVELDGEPLVRRGIRLLSEGGCDPVVVVVGAAATEVEPLCEGGQVVTALDWHTGMAASLRAGLEALDRSTSTACVIALVDQPLVSGAAVERLLAAREAGAVAAVATYDGRQRNPVLLDRSVWSGVTGAAVGDAGARTWLRQHPQLVVEVDCSDTGSPDDVDTPEDLHALLDPHRRREGSR
jgi:CTP:molybdopterin cytidylyltransferase MocA